jgi:hypothetical protein
MDFLVYPRNIRAVPPKAQRSVRDRPTFFTTALVALVFAPYLATSDYSEHPDYQRQSGRPKRDCLPLAQTGSTGGTCPESAHNGRNARIVSGLPIREIFRELAGRRQTH